MVIKIKKIGNADKLWVSNQFGHDYMSTYELEQFLGGNVCEGDEYVVSLRFKVGKKKKLKKKRLSFYRGCECCFGKGLIYEIH